MPKSDQARKAVKRLWAASQRAVVQSPLAAKLGLLPGLRLTDRYLRWISRSKTLAAPKLVTPSQRKLSQVWFIADVQWESHELFPELKKICETHVTTLAPATALPDPRQAACQLVEAAGKNVTPDLIILYAREGLLSSALFDLLRLKDVPIWGLNLDDKTEFMTDESGSENGRYGYSRWAKSFDLNLSSSRVMLNQYHQLGANAAYFPEGFHLRPEYLAKPPAPAHPLSFVGAYREDRKELLELLARYGLDTTIHGYGWPNAKSADAPWQVYRASQINLGIGFASPSRVTALKARDFECPGANACYLTTYNWELCEHFDLGREILCYRSPEELVEMLCYYLPRPELCADIAQAGFRRAQADHTWEKRFRAVFKTHL